MTNEQRHYHHVENLDDAKVAIKQLTDHTYDLRDQVAGHKDEIAKLKSSTGAKSGFTQDIAGIKIKAATDSASLQSGYTLRYNSTTGQFEFGV